MDDRALSWLLLLPAANGKRLLAVGLPHAQVVRLARHAYQIDWFPVAGTSPLQQALPPAVNVLRKEGDLAERYDLIIWGNSNQAFDAPSRLAPLGTMVSMLFAGSPWSARRFLKVGLHPSQACCTLPSRSPRLFIPLTDRPSILHGLRMHAPGSFKARWGLGMVRAMVAMGITAPLRHKGVVFATQKPEVSPTPALQHWLPQRLKISIDSLVVYGGSESPRRKNTILVISKGQPHCIVKAADTELGAEAIRHETAALQSLSTLFSPSQVPHLLFEEPWEKWWLQAQTLLPQVRSKQCRQITTAHWDFLRQLASLDSQTKPLGETPCWKTVQSGLPAENLPEEVTTALNYLKSPEVAGRLVPCYRSHGDFVPWNICAVEEGIGVFDWEESQPAEMACFDLFHFIYRPHALVGPWPGGGNARCRVILESPAMSCRGPLERKRASQLVAALVIARMAGKADRSTNGNT